MLTREVPFSHPVVDRLRPAKAGQEVEVPFWVADELINVSFAKLREEDQMDFAKLSKTVRHGLCLHKSSQSRNGLCLIHHLRKICGPILLRPHSILDGQHESPKTVNGELP